MGVALRDYVVLAAVVLTAALLAALICGAGRRRPSGPAPTYHVEPQPDAATTGPGVPYRRITLWNAGPGTLESDDAEDGDPLRIVAARRSVIQDARVVTVSRPENGVDVVHDANRVTCSFRYLCAGEGAVIEVATSGGTGALLVSGGFHGVPGGLDRASRLVAGPGSWPPRPADVVARGIGVGAAGAVGLVISWLAAAAWLRQLRDGDRLGWALALTVVAATGWLLWYGWMTRLARRDRRDRWRVPTALLGDPPGLDLVLPPSLPESPRHG